MKKTKSLYHGHRFPAVVINCAVRWYFRFGLSLRDVEELLLERGVVVTKRSVAGATNSELNSHSAPRRCGGSRAAPGTLTRCS